LDDPAREDIEVEGPLPPATVWLLGGILFLMTMFALYFARTVMVPVVAAMILYLLLQPALRALARLKVPRPLAALLVLAMLVAMAAAVIALVAAPATAWFERAPQSIARMEDRMAPVKDLLDRVQQAGAHVEKMAEGQSNGEVPVVVKGPGIGSALFAGTRDALTGLFTMVVLLFFLLMAGDQFLRRLVEIVPRLSGKKQVVETAHEIERNISQYLLTITGMNAAVGILTGIACWLCGLSDPLLWGTLAFLLNYIQVLGPLVGVAVIFMAGMLDFDSISRALVPAGIFLLIHLVEGESITPMLLARRFVLNPVLVILSLLFWYWMWGVAGALLAVPMLAVLKIICDRVPALAPLGHFLSGTPPPEPE
jgi:predicted PurR-regulated permease PerM